MHSGRRNKWPTRRLVLSLTACLLALGCRPPEPERAVKLQVRQLNLQVPKREGLIAAKQLDPSHASIELFNVSGLAPTQGQTCAGQAHPLGRISISMYPLGADEPVGTRPSREPPPPDVPLVDAPPRLAPEREGRRVAANHMRISSSSLQTTAAGWPIAACGRTCTIVFTVDDAVIEVRCGADSDHQITQRDIWRIGHSVADTINGWRVDS